MKKLLRTRPIWILVLSPILAGVLLTLGYAAVAKSRRADVHQTNSISSVASMPQPIDIATQHGDDDDPAQVEKRKEYLDHFYGTGPRQVSRADFAASLAAARSLPPSPLVTGQKWVSGSEGPRTPQPWTYPLLPPLYNFWAAGGASVRIDAIAVHPTDPDTLYVGSEGGLATSTDGGDHWTYLSDALSSQSIRSIAVDPVAPNIIYAGTGTQEQFAVGMFRSFDSGATWDIVGATEFASSTICKILVDPATAGSESKTTLYASVVKGDTDPSPYVDNSVHTLWRSDDSGTSWTIFFGPTSPSGSGAFAFYDIAYDPSGRLYFTAPSGVYRHGPGNTLTFIHNIPNPGAHSFLALDNQSAVYLAYIDGVTKIAKSTSYGNFWTELPASGADLHCFGVDPAHPSRIFVGGYTELRYTLDGGTTWLTAGGIHPDMHAIAVAPMQPPAPQTYYLGGDGGIHRADYPNSNPPSITFVSKNQNLPGILTQGVSISRDDRVLIGTQDNSNQIYRQPTPPWAPVFNQFLSGDGERPFIEFENNTEKMYVLALMPGFPNPRVVANIGAPCRIINNSPSSVTPPGAINEYTILYSAMSVQFKVATNTDRVIMGFQNVWRSVDSGNNWTRIGGTACPGPSPSATPNHNCGIASSRVITSVCEAPSDSNYIYAVADYGKQIFMTANANAGTGATWQDITRNLADGMSPDDISRVVVHPTDPLTVYLAGGHYVHKTSDGGATNWANEAVGPDFVFRDVIFHPADPNQILVASHRGVYARDVNGNWGSLGWALPQGMAWWGLSFNHYSHQLAAAGYGRGVYIIDLDRVPPTATVNFPTNGAYVRGAITVLGTAGDNHRVASAQLKLDGGNFPSGGGDTPDPNVSVNWNTAQSLNGSHVLTLVVYDPYGNHTTSAGVTVTVDNSPPTVSITEPENGKKVGGNVTVSADASDNNGVAGVQFYVDGDSFGDEVTSAPFSIDWDTTKLRNDEHTLVAVARDAAGNATTSSTVTVTTSN